MRTTTKMVESMIASMLSLKLEAYNKFPVRDPTQTLDPARYSKYPTWTFDGTLEANQRRRLRFSAHLVSRSELVVSRFLFTVVCEAQGWFSCGETVGRRGLKEGDYE
jgi:hypothetical protein